jgi:hypothetical protein
MKTLARMAFSAFQAGSMFLLCSIDSGDRQKSQAAQGLQFRVMELANGQLSPCYRSATIFLGGFE